jgi:hypothetical protein
LDGLLKKDSFLPDGGLHGFGFAHRYPFNEDSTKLPNLKGCLKGTDAALKRACDSVSLSTSVKAIYRDYEDSKSAVLLDHFANIEGEEIDELLTQRFKRREDGLIVYDFGSSPPEPFNSDWASSDWASSDSAGSEPIIWLKPLEETNTFSSTYIRYGNEPSLGYAYGELCLVATVPPASIRSR